MVVGPGIGRSGSSVDAVVGMTGIAVALEGKMVPEPLVGQSVFTPDDDKVKEGVAGSVGSCSDDATGFDGIKPMPECGGVVVTVMSVCDDEASGGSTATISDGMILDVRGADGMSPDGNDVPINGRPRSDWCFLKGHSAVMTYLKVSDRIF